jgi:hypothetical protein
MDFTGLPYSSVLFPEPSSIVKRGRAEKEILFRQKKIN